MPSPTTHVMISANRRQSRRVSLEPYISNVEMWDPMEQAEHWATLLASSVSLWSRRNDPTDSRSARVFAARTALCIRKAARLAPKWGASYGATAGFGSKRGEEMVWRVSCQCRDARKTLSGLTIALKRGDRQAAVALALQAVACVFYVRRVARDVLDRLCAERDKAFNAKQAKRKRDAAYRARKAAETAAA